MSIFPDTRLVTVAVVWTAAAVVTVLLPALWPVLLAALVVMVALTLWDAVLLGRDTPVAVERHFPPRAFVGREAEVILLLRNGNDRRVAVAVADDVLADLAASPSASSVVIASGQVATVRYTIRPTRRGDRVFAAVVALSRSPLGLLRWRTLAGAGESLRVYPDTTHFLRPEALNPRRALAALGVRPSRRRGEGMEFESLRDYVPGDDPRRLDWAASARRGRPVTRLYEHERNHTVVLALDASRLMAARVGQRTKLDFAIDALLALAYAALTAGDRLAMIVFDRSVRSYLAPRRHRRDLGQVVELLRTVHPRIVEPDYQGLVRALASHQRQRALVVVLTDFVEAETAGFVGPLAVLARRHRVLLVAVRDRLYTALDSPAPGASETGADLYRRLVLNELLTERESALATLRRGGLQTLDLPPEALTASVLNRYLAIRYGQEP